MTKLVLGFCKQNHHNKILMKYIADLLVMISIRYIVRN